ncbi:MAG: hypothetical protein J3Q66DRAFT_445729 [Benniella sp.]|nr:MAG: hypothetical protein J3Q66DRAFT_445729 [Benniella sp.]
MSREPLTIKSVSRSVFHAVVLVLSTSSILSVHAQWYQPECTREATYASLEGRGLYVLGGSYTEEWITGDAFMVDLSESWDISKPKYKRLMNAHIGVAYSPSGITSDGKLWTVLSDNQGIRYNAESNSWKEIFQFDTYGIQSLTGATDHKTDMMYIPFGYVNADGSKGMLRVNLKTGDTTSDRRPYSLVSTQHYATAWNPLRKSLIYISAGHVLEYTWEHGWKPFFKKGLDVLPIWSACLVSVSGGTKMALFGGSDKDDKPTGDIYVLDLTKKGKERWTKAPVDSKIKSEIARFTASCGSTGDQVIVYGGNAAPRSLGPQCPNQRMAVFNVKTMKWMDRYVAPEE